MREIKLWSTEGNLDGFVKRVKDEEKRAFIQEYNLYLENFYEEYYTYSGVERYIHEHMEYFDVF